MIEKLEGYKTYICAALYVLVVVLDHAGVLKGLDPAVVKSVEAALEASGLVALRAGVKKAENAATAPQESAS